MDVMKMAGALASAKARRTAEKALDRSVRDVKRMVRRASARKLDPRTGFLLGAVVALPLAYMAVRRLRG